jgi:hypothetical protein
MANDGAHGLSRRGFLKVTAAASLGTAATAAGVTAGVTPAVADELPPTPPHGAELRGMDLATQSPTTEGRFGFMFKNQPPHPASGTLLEDLGLIMEEQPVISTVPPVATKDDNDRFNENPNPLLTSGFTFVGQFVDHDITFDTTPLSDQQADPNATTNFRTPRYDLDAIYGLGPNQNPQLYDPNDRDKFKIVETSYNETKGIKGLVLAEPDVVYYPKPPFVVWDAQRDGAGKAMIADPRNDQTLIILQMHVAMQKFHNKLVDYMRALRVPRAAVFESARRLARWHYQWVVTHDFLPAIVGKAMADSVYKEVLTGVPIINIKYYKPTNPLGRPFIPVEFAVAAYRFGHSITRPRYTVQDVVTTSGTTVEVKSVPLFEAVAGDNNMNGSRAVPARLRIQWSKFFNQAGAARTARPVRQFDASLAGPLFHLPSSVQPDTTTTSLLAQRNLLRGRKMGLPSGQQVARLMGGTPLTNTQLSQNHRIKVTVPIPTTGQNPNVVNVESEFDEENANLTQALAKPEFASEAPLWFYILKEAELVGDGTADGKARTLGPVGGRIVAEVLVGLLQHDLNSYLYLNAAWKPAPPIAPERGKFTMADLLKYAGVWS